MFYEPSKGHPLPWDPFKAIVAPRPIGWISTVDRDGRANLAPYSFFSIVQGRPPMVSFASEGLKDSVVNARDTGEFVANLVTAKNIDAMNASSKSLPHGESEFEYAELETAPSSLVKPPRVRSSPASLECVVTDFFVLKDRSGRALDGFLVIGEVIGVHIDHALLQDGRFMTENAEVVARCGYRDYANVTDMFTLIRPDDRDGSLPGL
ncbi:flavin reductase family protein [Pseudaminobacter sp. 19-2017]|uniref:Flavin reductase family protein n=1 Tax=Pseudaminobacter soli (ex Zhang et al. 2022) TaxID=2831468 RepID=A0A942IBP0_9HYPH|nr:flavin reductase family protein [Pseudaminobacter soli]MBS3652490.1 flavin reductase family protein [Pseudaminobacter soli]